MGNPVNEPPTSSGLQWRVCADDTALARTVADRILAAATQAIAARGRFRLVLAGGRTPEAAYRLLLAGTAEWLAWELYLGDERCLPVNDKERNSQIAAALFARVPALAAHPIPAELGARAGAAAYEPVVASAVPFDLVLLGVGEDGHTASLFPGQVLETSRWVSAVSAAPKPPSDRISMSLKALRATREILVIAAGAGKAEALRAWRRGERLPIAEATVGATGLVLLDSAAAGGAS